MRTNIVLTLTGKDRTGLVQEVTKILLEAGCNVETSRMARLGGEFAVLMLFSMPADKQADLDRGIQSLTRQGFKVTTSPTSQSYAEEHAGWLNYKIQVFGADQEGIIHEVAHQLSQFGINIESMDTSTTQAPNSGAPLFSMSALVAVPIGLPGQKWKAALKEVEHRQHVDIKVSAIAKRQL